MRRLVFDPLDSGKRYILCYQGLCFAEAPLDGRGELRTLGELLGKLETIGVVANPDRGAHAPALYKCPDGGVIVANEVEYTILKRFLIAFINKIDRSLSRELDAALTWLDNAPEVSHPPAP